MQHLQPKDMFSRLSSTSGIALTPHDFKIFSLTKTILPEIESTRRDTPIYGIISQNGLLESNY